MSPAGAGEIAVLLEGPLVFEFQGDGAHETALRKGAPSVAIEARTALEAGKKLRSAKLTIARGDIMWNLTFDASSFVFRGLKLPKGDATDNAGRFQERMLSLRDFRQTFTSLFEQFLDERIDEARWAKTCSDVFAWVKQRDAKS
jgi:hypothetical protein